MKIPPLSVRLAMLWRSMLIQSTNNFEAMLSLGAVFTLYPLFKWIYRDDDEGLKRALVRNDGFFNTHPYFVNCILGVLGRLEADKAPRGPDPDVVRSVKAAMSGAFGGLGDSLFWATLMPLAALHGLVIYLFWPQYALIGAVAVLVLYSIPHLWVRYYFMERGFSDGTGVVSYLKRVRIPRLITVASVLAVILLGIYTTGLVWIPIKEGNFGYVAAVLSVMIIVLMQIKADKRTVPADLLWYLVIIVSIPLSLIISVN
jgi:mannose/fructose/N-acetylgalactosamine-specific phosphotransferase system component IID